VYNQQDLNLFNCSHVVHELSFGVIEGKTTMHEYSKNKEASNQYFVFKVFRI
jgi:hypothetical protein